MGGRVGRSRADDLARRSERCALNVLACLGLVGALAGCGDDQGTPGDAAGGSSGTGGSDTTAGASGNAGSMTGGGAAGAGGPNAGGAAGDTGNAGGSNATAGNGGMGGGGSAACDCVSSTLTFGPNGGFVAFTQTSGIQDCNTFVYERTTLDINPQTEMCSTMLDGCTDSIGVDDVSSALANADVQAALSGAPILFGVDSRPVDGTVYRIVVAGSPMIEVGGPCAGGQGCIPIPDGVQALATLLQALTEQELMKSACTDVFGSP